MMVLLRASSITLFGLVICLMNPTHSVAASISNDFFPEFASKIVEAIHTNYNEHPFVALPGLNILSPEPNQLRVQDLRGVECYPQPDNLEVCGAPDTTCFLFFTKSEERLSDINLTLRFGEGIEYGGFAEINTDDAVFPPPTTDIGVVSDQNPEAPSFLLSGVTRDSGAVYICFGIRAECGVDLSEFPPKIELDWEYTTESGLACEGVYTTPTDFSGDVITPRVQFTAPLPGLTNLATPGNETCQTINVSNSGVGSSATGYIFTAEDYGRDQGIEVTRLLRNGTELEEGADYEIDADGKVTANFDLSEDPLAFGAVDNIQICYVYEECYPDIDFSPTFTVVSACDGEVCTGPADENSTSTLGNIFNFPGFVLIEYDSEAVIADDNIENDGQPNVCADQPYVFDITLNTTNDTEVVGDINDVRLTLRACASNLFALDRILVIAEDGTTVGALDPASYDLRSEDRLTNTGAATADVAGTVTVDLRRNSLVNGGGLSDIDGDGFFDDLEAGSNARLRFFYEIICTADDASNATPAAAGSNQDCQFTIARVDARRGCNTRAVNNSDTDTGAPRFESVSTSSFVNGTDDLSGTLEGYDFGLFGNSGTLANCNPRPASTKSIRFQYNLGNNPLVSCTNSDPSAIGSFTIVGAKDLTDDFVFTNISFESGGVSTPIADADTSLTYTDEGVTLTLNGPVGSGSTGQDNFFTFDMTLDTNFCSPVQVLVFAGNISTICDGCDCDPVQTGSSTFLQGDPEDCGCDCYLDTQVTGRRVSRGFTDNTFTTLVPEIDAQDPQGKNVLAGDTIELTTLFRVRPEAANSTRFDNELGGTDKDFRRISFETWFNVPNNNNWNVADNFPTIIDYQLTRLQSITLIRNGVRIDIGSQFSGLENGPQPTTGILVGGVQGSTAADDFPGVDEIDNPGFPNGGYTFSTNNDGANDQRDGKRIGVVFRGDPANNGEANAVDKFLTAIGGEFLPEDQFETVWTTVLIDNPGQVDMVDGVANPEIPTTFSGYFIAEQFNNRPAGIASGLFERGCPQIPVVFNFFDPQVSSEARLVYEDDGCEGEITVAFRNDNVPAGWYPNEFRPITGIEQLTLEISQPYYFPGEGTFTNAGNQVESSIFADTSGMVDTAAVTGRNAYAPNAGIGTITFTDAEFADGVRPNGYDNFDNGINDITTVGGTLPLLSVGGTDDDSLVVRVPLRRLCGNEPIPSLTASYSWANKHLPDYANFTYRRRTNMPAMPAYWDGKVTNNNGAVVSPISATNSAGVTSTTLLVYFPFERLPNEAGDEINPHRSTGNVSNYQIINAPELLTANTAIVPAGILNDEPGDETKTATISPGGGQELGGVVLIEIGRGAILSSVTEPGGGPMIAFAEAGLTDSTTLYTVEIPSGLGTDAEFSFDINTDQQFCAASEICVVPILGCTDDPALTANAYAAFRPTCNTNVECYNYSGGEASVSTTIDDPRTIGLCETQTFAVQYFNDGTSPLANFSPILYIPEGLDVSNFSGQVVGGPATPLADPTNDVSTDAVFGTGNVFDEAELAALFGPDGFAPGQFLTITFDGATSCDFTSGVPLVTVARSDAACAIEYEAPEAFSRNIDVLLPPQPATLFSFDADNQPLEISCSESGDALILTVSNVGKASAAEAEICARLPAGISFDLDNINTLAPAGYTVSSGDVTTTPINGSGDVQTCFTAPPLEQGAFVCLEIPFIVEDLDCGPYFVGTTVITNVEVTCATSGEMCEIPVSTTEMLYFELNVVPPVTANNASLSAACTGSPGVFDVIFDLEFLAESQPYAGEVNLTLFGDVDGNGELDRGVDEQIGEPRVVSVLLAQDEAEMYNGIFAAVDQSQVCPLLLVIESSGCACSESVLPFPNVMPDFIDDLGDDLVLCPGEPFTLDGICANLNYAFENPAAGTVTTNEVTGEATIMLNPGFGVNAREALNITGSLGSCGLMKRISVSTVPDLDFGPYEYSVCNTGSQEVDLNIPRELQEDISVEILNPVNVENPNSVEPSIRDLQQDMTYDVVFSFNDGQCTGMSTLDITVEEAVIISLNDLTGCASGFNLSDRIMLSPADATGTFQSDGDGEFTAGGEIPGEVSYIPGPLDIEAGSVNLRFRSNDQPGPCGTVSERIVATILLVDCGDFFWDGSRD